MPARRWDPLRELDEFREAEPERVEGHLSDGVLAIRVPKSERSQARRIDIIAT